MREREAPGRAWHLHNQAAVDGLLERAQRRVERQPFDLGGKLEIELGAEHRAGGQQRYRLAAQPRDAVCDHLLDACWNLDRVGG